MRRFIASKMQLSSGRIGPEPTSLHRSDAAPQLHQTSRSCIVQHSGAATDGSADHWRTCVRPSLLARTASETSGKKPSADSRAKMARPGNKHPPPRAKLGIANPTLAACMPRSNRATIREHKHSQEGRTCRQLIKAVNLILR